MNRLLILLAFYLTALAILPCADEVLAGDHQQSEQIDNHSDDAHHEDECGIFCVCNCCGHFVNITPGFVLQLFDGSFPDFNIHSGANKPIDAGPAIWQPPKLV